MSEGGFWVSDIGIDERVEMLADHVTFSTFNFALVTEGKKMGYLLFSIQGMYDPKTCDWCSEHLGREYKQEQFMPDIPKHPNCRCFWDVTEKPYST